MTLSEEKNRHIISGAATILIHGALLLIPLATSQLPPGEMVSGYIASLVQIPESSGVSPKAKPAVTGESAPVVVPETPTPNPKKVTPSSTVTSPADIRTAEKKPEKKPEAASPVAGTGGDGKLQSGEGVTGDRDNGPALPTRPSLGNGKGQIVSGKAPFYPKSAQNEMITGAVRYRLIVDATGKLRSSEKISSSGDTRLDNTAHKSLTSQWQFSPQEASYFLEMDIIFSADGTVRAEHVRAGWEDELK